MLRLVILVLTLIISIIPEAVTLAVIYCLSEYSSLQIFSQGKVIFKNVRTLENAGRISVLCLEKAGTLTQVDKMWVNRFYTTL